MTTQFLRNAPVHPFTEPTIWLVASAVTEFYALPRFRALWTGSDLFPALTDLVLFHHLGFGLSFGAWVVSLLLLKVKPNRRWPGFLVLIPLGLTILALFLQPVGMMGSSIK